MNAITEFYDATSILQLFAAIDEFDGDCHPDFDSDQEELERQFADYRLILASA